MKAPAISLVAAALSASAAVAQTPPQAQSGPFIAHASEAVMRASKIVGLDVIGLDEHRIGEVRELIMPREGQVEAVVIGVGGLLGMGGKSVAVPFDAMLWNRRCLPRGGSERGAAIARDGAPRCRPAAGHPSARAAGRRALSVRSGDGRGAARAHGSGR